MVETATALDNVDQKIVRLLYSALATSEKLSLEDIVAQTRLTDSDVKKSLIKLIKIYVVKKEGKRYKLIGLVA